MTFSWVKNLLKNPKARVILILSLILTLSTLLSLFAILDRETRTARAASTLEMYKGQTKKVTINYRNEGDQDTASAFVRIYIGNATIVDTNSIRERFDTNGDGSFETETEYCVSPNSVTTDQNIVFNWGYAIRYRPRSATTVTAPCDGSSTDGPSVIPVNYGGIITFDLTLRTDTNYPIGTTLTTAANQGIKAEIFLDGNPGVGAETNISIVDNPGGVSLGTASSISGTVGDTMPNITLSGTTVSDQTSASFTPNGCLTPISGSIQVSNGAGSWAPATGTLIPTCVTTGSLANGGTLSATGIVSIPVPTNFTLGAGTTITPINIESGSCIGPVVIPESTNCTFPLSGDSNNNYVLPVGGISAAISQNGNGVNDLNPVAGGYSTCTLENNQTANVQIACPTISSTGATPGVRNIILRLGSNNPIDKADIILTSQTLTNIKTGNIYFLSANNTSVSFDSTTQINTNYDQTQKFRDGNVTIVYSNIKNSSDTAITSGVCVFKLYRYGEGGDSQPLKIYSSNISNGSCQTILTAEDQTVNYYRVRAEVVENSNMYYNLETLILYVGGGTTAQLNPIVE